MDTACLPVLLRVTTAVLDLGVRVAAGDEGAVEELKMVAGVLAK